MYNAKELKIDLKGKQIAYITFGMGTKPLIMIQGLNTNGIKGAANSLAYMYRIFAKDYKVYLFDRRAEVYDGITVRELAADIAEAMDALGLQPDSNDRAGELQRLGLVEGLLDSIKDRFHLVGT